jgi:nicotinamide riboside transporter PnuC
MTIELFGIITTLLAVSGVILNNRLRIECFYLWFVSNLISAVIHAEARIWSLCIRDMIFLILAVEGIWLWSKK